MKIRGGSRPVSSRTSKSLTFHLRTQRQKVVDWCWFWTARPKRCSGLALHTNTKLGSGTRVQSMYLGLDFGTSGARAIVIDEDESIVHSEKVEYGAGKVKADDAGGGNCSTWEAALFKLLGNIPGNVSRELRAICIDGTSSTSFLVNRNDWTIQSRPLLYNFAAETSTVNRVKEIAPEGNITISSTSTLCKLFTWLYEDGIPRSDDLLLLHQADWLSSLLLEQPDKAGVSDYNNALKLGYDPGIKDYPEWMKSRDFASILPQTILAPSTPIGNVSPSISDRYGINGECQVAAGTTDSIAAFLAAGASDPGEAVTSLGSTLAIKALSTKRVDNLKYGIYSHKLWGDLWLAGGASNTGGAVLRKYFSDEQLAELSSKIDVKSTPQTGLNYYPLLTPGERFPIADPNLEPKLDPRPADDTLFLHGILEGIAEIEKLSFDLLQEEGCSTLTRVMTCGGGSKNSVWTQMREILLGVPVSSADNTEAAFGSARLAQRSQLGK